MKPRRSDNDYDFYERIARPLNIEEDAEIFVVEEEESEKPWTTPPRRPGGKNGESPQARRG